MEGNKSKSFFSHQFGQKKPKQTNKQKNMLFSPQNYMKRHKISRN